MDRERDVAHADAGGLWGDDGSNEGGLLNRAPASALVANGRDPAVLFVVAAADVSAVAVAGPIGREFEFGNLMGLEAGTGTAAIL